MNTSKQINLMVVLIFLLLIGLGAYTLFDPGRQEDARAQQTEITARRGAALFAQYCRPCHGDTGQGRVGPALNRADLRDPLKLDINQAFVYNTINCGRVGAVMPTWGQANGGPLNDEQIHDLVVLVTIDPNDAWDKYVKPLSETANKVATPAPVEDLANGPTTGSKESVCGQKIAGTAAPEAVGTPGQPSTTLTEETMDNKFSDTTFTVPAGQQATLTLSNKGQNLHDWHVLNVKDDSGKDIKTGPDALVAAGGTGTVSFSIAKPGTYKFQCDVHPTEMKGTLFVSGAANSAGLAGAATQAPASQGAPNPLTGTGIQTPASGAATGGTAGPAGGSGQGAAPTRTATP